MAAWTEAELARIKVIQEERSCTRENAYRVLRAEQKRAAIVDPLKQATPVPTETIPLSTTVYEPGAAQSVENPKQEASPVKTKKVAKPKKEARKTLSSYGHGKEERTAEAKKLGVPEFELCAKYSRKYGLEVPPCVLRWEKKREQREAKAAEKKAAKK
jgi:hypothetical protein